ncbi:hypothetical protein [Pantoea cypripedii]|uniref:hypothetical protein n=1 Tax=Pantoea cypripedii TaxID=55209 RepID=UPI001ABF2D18|nr:hypothetical protein [Pantoea cypripedii]
MMTIEEVLDNARKTMARNRFTPKVKCSICFGRGTISCYPIFNNAGTGEIVRKPCQHCGGTGEHAAW